MRQRIERGDFDAVETAWLERVDEDLDDLDFFSSVARTLSATGQPALARTLLELLDEALIAKDMHQMRLDLLQAVGEVAVPKARLHAATLERLRDLHSANPSLEGLIETLEIGRRGDASHTWGQIARLENLLQYTEGTIVWLEGKGAGRVEEVNYGLQGFKVEVEGKGSVRVGFRAATKVLQALDESHFLVRKRTKPETLSSLPPAELLEQLLISFSRPLLSSEIRDALYGLVDLKKWNSWWTTAKRHPQVVSSREVRNAYTWATTSEEASGAMSQQFDAASPRRKIELFRRASSQDSDLLGKMRADLLAIAKRKAGKETGLAFEIALALERDDNQSEISSRELVGSVGSLAQLVAGVDSKAMRDQAYRLAREIRKEWIKEYEAAIPSETYVGLVALLIEGLRSEDPGAFKRTIERGLARPAKAPALFTWIAETAAEEEALRATGGARLFRKILNSLSQDAFSAHRARLSKLCESGGTIPRLLDHLSEEDAVDALEDVRRSSALGVDQRRALEDALLLRFPSLRETNEPLYALQGSIDAKRTELKAILEEEIPANRRAIEEARAMGDLRENFEYKSARQRHEYLTARAQHLNDELERSQPLELDSIDASAVRVGTTVVLKDGDGGEETLSILGPWESAPTEGILSYESEVARKLLGKELGDVVELSEGSFTVADIKNLSPGSS